MKNLNINVDFKDPVKELQSNLQRQGARNIDIRRNYNGDVEIRYTIKLSNPEKEITDLLSRNGAQNVRTNSSYSGAKFEFRIDDRLDEREFKKKISDTLRKSGYRSN